MSTNVKPEDLNYDHYESKRYNDEIISSIPGHEEIHQHIDRVIEREYILRGRIKILELGVGTGLTAERILRKIPNINYTAIDFSDKMLEGARKLLSQYHIRFVKGDYGQIILPQNNDLIVSVIGMHHQETNEDKKILFQKVYNSLNKNGAFIFGDLMTYRNPMEAALNEAKHFHYLVENAKNKESLMEWAHHHKYLNKLASIEDQIEWLREVGFSDVAILYQRFNTALIYAKN
ncbi:MAG TPA: class I SAM-dependent methyltransferase [Candidatus Nanoarchaeia archaeon]|nr:class I SAM-dependent methyltransferase [Candidatus Nanoarchaeia archaeon]